MTHSLPRRRLRCIIIGAGHSHRLLPALDIREDRLTIPGHKLKEAFGQSVDIQIFEKNEDVGGTWFENRYPGCACDVPSHIYQFSFCPNPYWSSFYASSREIQAYLKAVVFHYGIDKHINFKCKIERAEWSPDRNIWTVSVSRKGRFECDILINAGGILNNLFYPRLKNIEQFRGPLLHTAAWDENIDLRGKRIAIIGAGASAIQCLPQVQTLADHVAIYIRTPSWISPPAGGNINQEHNHIYTKAEITRFKNDPAYSCETRKKMETSFNTMYQAFIKGSEQQREIRNKLELYMMQRIKSPVLREKLIPTFDVGCRRINPGEAYLTALQQPNVTPVFESVEEIMPDGIVAGGKLRPTDIIIAATGFDTSFRPRFPIVGTAGKDLRELWKNDPVSYFGLAVSGFPNYLMFLGPNTPISNGSLMGTLEVTADYCIRVLKKLVDEHIVSFNVRSDVQSDFDKHTQKVMQEMVWSGPCSSWYKARNGKVTALWPGSSLHYRQILDSNRWEDFEWTYSGNRFAYWSQGVSEVEEEQSVGNRDLAYYIKSCDNLPLEAYYLAAKGYTPP